MNGGNAPPPPGGGGGANGPPPGSFAYAHFADPPHKGEGKKREASR